MFVHWQIGWGEPPETRRKMGKQAVRKQMAADDMQGIQCSTRILVRGHSIQWAAGLVWAGLPTSNEGLDETLLASMLWLM